MSISLLKYDPTVAFNLEHTYALVKSGTIKHITDDKDIIRRLGELFSPLLFKNSGYIINHYENEIILIFFYMIYLDACDRSNGYPSIKKMFDYTKKFEITIPIKGKEDFVCTLHDLYQAILRYNGKPEDREENYFPELLSSFFDNIKSKKLDPQEAIVLYIMNHLNGVGVFYDSYFS